MRRWRLWFLALSNALPLFQGNRLALRISGYCYLLTELVLPKCSYNRQVNRSRNILKRPNTTVTVHVRSVHSSDCRRCGDRPIPVRNSLQGSAARRREDRLRVPRCRVQSHHDNLKRSQRYELFIKTSCHPISRSDQFSNRIHNCLGEGRVQHYRCHRCNCVLCGFHCRAMHLARLLPLTKIG